MVESKHARSRVARQQASSSLEKIRGEKINELSLEKFAAVRDWYHMAILEMTEIKGFRSDVSWLSQALGLPVNIVREAVERLQSLGLLSCIETPWRQTQKDMELPSGVPSRTIREHHKQILTKAIVAIDSNSVEKREYSSMTFAFDKNLMPELKSAMREFQRKMSRLASSGEKNSVYVLSVQLFPVWENQE